MQLSALILGFFCSIPQANLLNEPLSEKNFEAVKQWIAPKTADTAFESIPWRATLWEAIVEANRQDKPILLWAMNGHPLGCT